MEFKHFLNKENVLLKDIVLGPNVCPSLNEGHIDELYKWMIANDDKIVFFFDGYDQIVSSLEEDFPNPGYYKKGNEHNFIKHVLCKNLFPRSSIVSSSREYAARYLPVDCLPENFVQLSGFINTDIDKIIEELSPSNVLQYLKKQNIYLYSLCSNPLLMDFITFVYSQNATKPPETMTGIMVTVLYNFLTSSHARNNSVNILSKLTKMAHYGTWNHKVVFNNTELKQFDLENEEIADLTISILSPFYHQQATTQSILDGNFKRYCFV